MTSKIAAAEAKLREASAAALAARRAAAEAAAADPAADSAGPGVDTVLARHLVKGPGGFGVEFDEIKTDTRGQSAPTKTIKVTRVTPGGPAVRLPHRKERRRFREERRRFSRGQPDSKEARRTRSEAPVGLRKLKR